MKSISSVNSFTTGLIHPIPGPCPPTGAPVGKPALPEAGFRAAELHGTHRAGWKSGATARASIIGSKAAAVLLGALLIQGFQPLAAQDDAKPRTREGRERAKTERDQERRYQQGVKALDKKQWQEALDAFSEVAEAGGSRADGAWYWKAYAQNKLGRRQESLASLAELNRKFPDSRWSNDAKALEVELRQGGLSTADAGSQGDEDLKLIAVNSLMHTDPDKALPILEKLLAGNQSPRIREKALFVLSQSGSDKAREIVANFARGKANPDLQLKSLEYLALFGGKESRQVLADVYASSADIRIRRSILGFFMVGGDRERLLAAALR